jgi:hypothetical protein
MNHIYLTPIGFAHAVRYREGMVRAWAKRTGRMSRSGAFSYKPEDLPDWLDVPTNEERSAAEVIEFRLRPLQHGQQYTAYLTHAKPEHRERNDQLGLAPDMWRGVITTWTGELLAIVTKITSYNAVCFGRDAGTKGSFWAIGIDGRTYYGRHNGKGMYCRMRLAKWADEYDIEQHTSEGWEVVSSEHTHLAARGAIREYRENQPELDVRVKHRKVRQT